jgi:hypothetical protein
MTDFHFSISQRPGRSRRPADGGTVRPGCRGAGGPTKRRFTVTKAGRKPLPWRPQKGEATDITALRLIRRTLAADPRPRKSAGSPAGTALPRRRRRSRWRLGSAAVPATVSDHQSPDRLGLLGRFRYRRSGAAGEIWQAAWSVAAARSAPTAAATTAHRRFRQAGAARHPALAEHRRPTAQIEIFGSGAHPRSRPSGRGRGPHINDVARSRSAMHGADRRQRRWLSLPSN